MEQTKQLKSLLRRRREHMNGPEMKRMASLFGENFVEGTIAGVQQMIRQEKQHLASTFKCVSVHSIRTLFSLFINKYAY